MSEQALKRILLGLAVLVAVYGLTVLLRGGLGDSGSDAGALAAALSRIDSATVREVVFRRPGDTVTLARSGDGWTVNGYDADSSRISSLFGALSEENAGGVIARNPANHARLGVSADSATRAVFRGPDGDSTVLLVGASGSSFPSVYVRIADQDPVHLLEGELRTAARRTADQWRDRRLLRMDTASVARVTMTRDGAEYTLERGEDGWTVDGAAADAAAVRDLLSQLASMDATGFEPDGAQLVDPARTITVRDAEGQLLAELAIGETEGSSVLVQRADGGPVYRVSQHRADRLTPEPGALTGEEGSPPRTLPGWT